MISYFEVIVYCEKVQPGCTFFAKIFDRATGKFFGGSGPTALEAVAWCLDEYVRRVVLGHGPMASRNADARPGDCMKGAA